ncbi:hypothetical protein PRK78_002793 [Emydomyces testavorans]|uniref:Uncharacterized protein n=1 Tax=Emydomyces testavorans TaxID=2070801 RepID=A0AAF0IHV7_9EURO|nr:hypothetical protein PRK78_002793 [Emydomyces testavorans]
MAPPSFSEIWDSDWEEAYASPETEVMSLPSSGSQRSRRTQGSFEDSLDGFPLQSQEYRIGGPSLPALGSTWKLIPPSPLHSRWESTLKVGVKEILLQHRIYPEFLHLVSYPVTGMAAAQSPTIMIRTKAMFNEQEWVPAARSIRRYCLEMGHSELKIEFIDERAFEKTLSYPVHSSEEVVRIWPNVKDDIISCLKGKEWISLSLLQRGKPSGPKRLTVVLTVATSSSQDWVPVREDIIRVLDSQQLKHVGVEILRGANIFTNSEDQMILDDDSFSMKMGMGRSVGPRNTKNRSSTFGGFVRLQKLDGNWYTFGLTCFRSVVPLDCNHPSLAKWKQSGISVDDKSKGDLQMDSPSLGDAEETIRAWKVRIDTQKDQNYMETELRLQNPDEFVITGDRNRYVRAKKIVDIYENKASSLKQFLSQNHQCLGRVFAASGFRLSDSKKPEALDWALITVNSHRLSKNQVFSPHLVRNVQILTQRQLPDPTTLPQKYLSSSFTASEEYIPGMAELAEDMDLFKIGRSTGFTAGRLNGVKTTTLHSWTRNEKGQMEEKLSEAYCVVPDSAFNSVFGTAGDSGSFVLDNRGCFVGLYFGGSTDGTGYFSGATELIHDIKMVTGACDVRFDV